MMQGFTVLGSGVHGPRCDTANQDHFHSSPAQDSGAGLWQADSVQAPVKVKSLLRPLDSRDGVDCVRNLVLLTLSTTETEYFYWTISQLFSSVLR